MQTVCCCSGVGNQSIDSSIRIFKESTKKMKKFRSFFFFFGYSSFFTGLFFIRFQLNPIDGVGLCVVVVCKDLFSRSFNYFDS